MNFLSGTATAPKVLERPSAVPLLLRHISSGKASDQLPTALVTAAERADFGPRELRFEDGQATIALLTGRHGAQVGGSYQVGICCAAADDIKRDI